MHQIWFRLKSMLLLQTNITNAQKLSNFPLYWTSAETLLPILLVVAKQGRFVWKFILALKGAMNTKYSFVHACMRQKQTLNACRGLAHGPAETPKWHISEAQGSILGDPQIFSVGYIWEPEDRSSLEFLAKRVHYCTFENFLFCRS